MSFPYAGALFIMEANMSAKNQKPSSFVVSLFSALLGLGLLGSSIYLGAKDNFLATLLTKGGAVESYLYAAGLAFTLLAGITLIARHVAREGVAENFYEHTPY